MPNSNEMHLSRLGWPKCETCDRLMRLVEMAPHEANPRSSLHTYECDCGGKAAVVVTRTA